MKSVCTVLLALSGASAFAPAQTARTSTKLAASEDLVGLRGGNGPESGGQIVSHLVAFLWLKVVASIVSWRIAHI
jgi:hypothetical protein